MTRSLWTEIVGYLLVAISSAVTVGYVSTVWLDAKLEHLSYSPSVIVIGLVALSVGILLASHGSKSSAALGYDRLLARLGFVLVVTALSMFIALFGLASRGVLPDVLSVAVPREAPAMTAPPAPSATQTKALPPGLEYLTEGQAEKAALKTDSKGKPREQVVWAARMALLPCFAVLGSLFFVCGSLRRKRGEDNAEEAVSAYDGGRFWSGFWYRLGEGVLFSLIAFLASYAGLLDGEKPWSGPLLLVGLLMAMFVKPAEQLVNGLALRLFEAVNAFTSRNLSQDAGKSTDPMQGIVNRLRSESEMVRLRAIAELERSAMGGNADAIEVLASFVRQPPNPPREGDPAPIDVQKALGVLGRPAKGKDRPAVSLRRAVLRGMRSAAPLDLHGIDLSFVDLEDADLKGANLEGASFEGAKLEGANLEGVSLEGANLEGANLADVKGLTEATWKGAKNYEKVVAFPPLS